MSFCLCHARIVRWLCFILQYGLCLLAVHGFLGARVLFDSPNQVCRKLGQCQRDAGAALLTTLTLTCHSALHTKLLRNLWFYCSLYDLYSQVRLRSLRNQKFVSCPFLFKSDLLGHLPENESPRSRVLVQMQ